jgi:nucleoside-diphosphate-sugar epimerase
MSEIRKIIVTGGGGFLGRRLVDLLKDNYEVFDKVEGKDITKPEDFENLDGDYVIHLAALTRCRNDKKMFNVNVGGTLNVLEFCRRVGARLIFASSAAVYGNIRSPVKEDAPLQPISFYGLTKLVGEELCRFYNNHYNVPAVILRIFNLYGPGQQGQFLIPDIVSQLNEEKIVLRNQYPKRDFVYVDDAVEAIVRSRNLEGYNVINIGTGESYSVGEIAEKIVGISKGRKQIGFLDDDKIESDIYADISKARRLLGWQPKVSLEQGLERVLKS